MPWLHRKDNQILIYKRKVVIQHHGHLVNMILDYQVIQFLWWVIFRSIDLLKIVYIFAWSMFDMMLRRKMRPLVKTREKYSSCFLEDLPRMLPLVSYKDQKIGIILGSSPPNILPYTKEEEIRKQVTDLLDRRLVPHPTAHRLYFPWRRMVHSVCVLTIGL